MPYQTNAYLDRTQVSDGSMSIWIRMLNLGEYATSAAHFAIYANAYRSGGPWQYTIGADSGQEDFFNVGSGKYDFTVIGPNRFLRSFTGDASKVAQGKHVSVKFTFEIHSSSGKLAVIFNMKNHGTQNVVFRIKSNQYRTWDKTYSVAVASQETEFFNAVSYNAGWYDFTITVDNDATWSERFTGHIEYGQSSTTG
nr:phospholipase domain-containing protein [Streptomyces albireticuli]